MVAKSANGGFLVIGSAGAVGRLVCAEVVRQCGVDSLVLGDYRLERAAAQVHEYPGAALRRIDVRDDSSIREAIDPTLAGVIVCLQQNRPEVQLACVSHGVPCIDVTITQDLLDQIHELDGRAREASSTLLTMAGMWPGLSGLMAMRAAEMLDDVDTVDLALCQSTNSTTGPAGIKDMMTEFSKTVSLREGTKSRQVPGFSATRSFEYPAPFGTRRHRLVDFVERSVIAEALGVFAVNLWTGFDSVAFDRLVSLLRRSGVLDVFRREAIGMRLARLVNSAKEIGPSGPEPVAVVAVARGRRNGDPAQARVSMRGPSDYGITAMCAVAFARLAASRRKETAGAGHPLLHFGLQEVVDAIDNPELEFCESESIEAEEGDIAWN